MTIKGENARLSDADQIDDTVRQLDAAEDELDKLRAAFRALDERMAQLRAHSRNRLSMQRLLMRDPRTH